MQTVLTAMLARMLKALDINDSLILCTCQRTVERTVAEQLDPASAKDKIDELVVQCKGILDGGTKVGRLEQLPALLEIIGIDPLMAKLSALQPALERVWALVGLSPQAPMLKRVQTSLQALATALPEEIEAKFATVRTNIKSLAASIAEGDSVAAVPPVFNLLTAFDVPLLEAMQTVLTAMLARVLKALDIGDNQVLSTCQRAVERAVVEQLDSATVEQPIENVGLGKLVGPEASTAPLLNALAEAVLLLGASSGIAQAPPFSLDQALKLLEALGVSAQDALLSIVSGMFLRKALEAVGVPATHGFQKEARGAVLQLAHRTKEERRRKLDSLKSALQGAGTSVGAGSIPIGPLVAALVEFGIPAKSMAMVMAPLMAQAVLQAAGIPKSHGIMLRVARAARAVVIHARTFEEACGMIGARAASTAGSATTMAATGAAGAVSGDSGPQTAAQAVVSRLGIPMAALHAGLQAAAAAAEERAKKCQRPARRFSSHFEEELAATAVKVASTSAGSQYKVAPEREQKEQKQVQQQLTRLSTLERAAEL
jgi:hypothetical protein